MDNPYLHILRIKLMESVSRYGQFSDHRTAMQMSFSDKIQASRIFMTMY